MTGSDAHPSEEVERVDGWKVLCLGIGLAPGAVSQMPTAPVPWQQEFVLPWSHAGREGSGATNVPFGRSVPVRVQLAYDRTLLPTPVQIASLQQIRQIGKTAVRNLSAGNLQRQ